MRLQDLDLAKLSYFGTGGRTQRLYCPQSTEEASSALKEILKEKKPYFIIGLGSNSLISDENWEGSVISLKDLTHIQEKSSGKLLFGAGVENSEVAKKALEKKLTGAEWMYRLPGQLGATTRMNARCYGGEISQVVSKVIGVTSEGVTFQEANSPKSCTLFEAYKKTRFMTDKSLITEVELTLESADSATILQKMQNCENDRENKKQFDYPSCGCVFKNNYSPEISVPSGLLLEVAGSKKLSKGAAKVSPHHANFVYNLGGALADDILQLTFAMQEAVWDYFTIWLEYEMEVLGSLKPQLAMRLKEKRISKPNKKALAPLQEAFHRKNNTYKKKSQLA